MVMIIILIVVVILILRILLKNWLREQEAKDKYWSDLIDDEINAEIDKFERDYDRMNTNRQFEMDNQMKNIDRQERRENADLEWRKKWGL